MAGLHYAAKARLSLRCRIMEGVIIVRDLSRRLKALETLLPTNSASHCLQWWPGKSWEDVLAAHGGGEAIRRGDRVMLLKFEAAGVVDPVKKRDAASASEWLRARGVCDA